MSVLIKGMEMPKEGSWIELRIFPDGQCFLYSWCGNDFDFMEHLTAAPVPPHGRLGDLDELYNHLNEWYITHENGFSETEKIYIRAMLSGVKDSPTIIEAEEQT